MANVKQLRLRIKSIKSTKKITKAMQMVSASKLRRARIALESTQYYHEAVNHALSKATKADLELSPLAKAFLHHEHEEAPKLVVVFGSDRGLCGGFNNSVLRMLKHTTNEDSNTKIMAIGKRAINFVNIHYPDLLVAEYNNAELDRVKLSEVAEQILTMVKGKAIGNIELYFSFFKNTISQIPTQKQIMPIKLDDKTNSSCEVEGDSTIDDLIAMYVTSELAFALAQSRASEEAARTTAMDSATRNADKMLNQLTLVMNRTRQASITKELIEIISGAEAV